jgi:hypothetical protein
VNDTTRLVGRVAAWTTAALLGAALLSGYAQAQSGSGAPAAQPQAGASAEPSATPRPSRSPGARPTDRPKRPEGERRENRRRAPGRIGPRVLHGETVVATDQGNVTHVVQRGVVTAISGSSFTVRSADGFTLTWSRNADTKVRTAPKDQQQRALRVGDDVMSHGVRNGSSVLARQVRLVPEKAASDNDDDSQPA